MSWGERNDSDGASPTAYVARTHDRRLRIVPSLHQDVRPQCRDQLERRVLVEYHDGVDHPQGGQHVASLRCAPYRTLRSLEPAHRLVAVDSDDERVTLPTRAKQHVDVAGVQ